MKDFIQFVKCLFGCHPMLIPFVLGINPERSTYYELIDRLRAECLQCRAYFKWFDLTEQQRRALYECDRWMDAVWQPIHSPSHVLPHLRLTRKVRLDFCDGPGDAHQDGCPAKPAVPEGRDK